MTRVLNDSSSSKEDLIFGWEAVNMLADHFDLLKVGLF